jgi:hypothetical protein
MEKYDCVMTNYVPFRTAVIGAALKREFGIPWVARFPDPSPHCLYPPPYATGRPVTVRDRYVVRMLKGTFRNADALIAPSARMAAYINRTYDGAFGDREIVLPHVGWSRPGSAQEVPGRIRILHPGIRMHGRESKEIVTALRRALDAAMALGIDVHLTFAGYVSGKKTLPQQLSDLRDGISWVAPRSYEETLAQMASATALLLVEAVMSEGVFLPSKIADYAVSGKPVLMFSPTSGTIADLVGGVRHPGFLTQNPEQASQRLVDFFKRASAGANLDQYRFPDPSHFSPERVVSVLVGGLARYCNARPEAARRKRAWEWI